MKRKPLTEPQWSAKVESWREEAARFREEAS